MIVTADSPELARAFTIDFEELWADGDVERSGFAEPPGDEVKGVGARIH